MSSAAIQIAPTGEAPPAGWITLADAAERMRVSDGHLRRLCAGQYAASRLAGQFSGKWYVSRKIDPKLSGFETREQRDDRQLAEMHRNGVPQRFIDQAVARRDLVIGLGKFDCRAAAGDRERRKLYLAHRGLLEDPLAGCGERTLRRWRDAYNKPGDEGGVRAMLRKLPSRTGNPTIGASAEEMLLGYAHAGTGISISAAWEQVRGHILAHKLEDDPAWRLPTKRTVQDWYQRCVPEPAKVLVIAGPHRMRQRCIPAIRRARGARAAGDSLVGDQRTFDFLARVEGDRGWYPVRLKLTSWIDLESSRFVGWYIGRRANTDTILAAFNMACRRMGTVPREAVIDNGADYRAVGGGRGRNRKWDDLDSTRVQTAFEALGVTVHYSMPRNPRAKSQESIYRVVKDNLDRFQPSFIGGTPQERPHDAIQWARENILNLPTIDAVREAFAAFVSEHDERPSRGDGMDGLSPRQVFEQRFTANPRRASESVLDAACCRLVGPKMVGRDGVRWDGIMYGGFDESVFRLQGRKVWLRVDPTRADHVTLCEKDGTALAIARENLPIGTSREEVRERIAFQRRCERSIKQYARSRDFLVKTPPGQIAELRRIAAKAQQIPDSKLPTPPGPQTVTLVRPDLDEAERRAKRAAGAEALRRLHAIDAAAEDFAAGPRPMDLFTMPVDDDADAEFRTAPAGPSIFEAFKETRDAG